MRERETEGWKKIGFVKKTCLGCKFLESELIKSGLNPIREYRCQHPISISRFALHPMQEENGILIGRKATPPNWCPTGEQK